MSLDRLYNAHTRRIITAAAKMVNHFACKWKRELTICSTKKNPDTPDAKGIKYATLKISLIR